MKIGLFADLHYDIIPDADRRIEDLVVAFKKERVDFVLELGDFCLSSSNRELLKKMNSLKIPIHYTIGNHNTDYQPLNDVINYFGMDKSYYSFIQGNIKFIVLDSNYIKIDNEFIPFEVKNYYKTKGKYPYVPDFEIEWLVYELDDDYPCIICTHQSLTNSVGHNGIVNRERIRSILEKSNQNRKNKVLLCLNGHDHGSCVTIVNGIVYYGINSCSYFWQEYQENYCFNDEIHEKYPMLKNMVLYDEALHSIIEIDDCFNIIIKGMEGKYLNVTPEEIGMPYLVEGVSVAPKTVSLTIQSGKIKIY